MTGLLTDKVAIITGGTSGIGLAAVRRFHREGASVVIADILDEPGEALAADLGESALFVHTDVTSEGAVEHLVDTTVEKFGRLDVMYNNAGAAGDTSPMVDLTADGFDRTHALLTRSVLLGHKYAARQYITQNSGGSIITTSSAAALQGGWSSSGYTVSKHAVTGIIRQAVAELAPLGIRSNAIAPGVIMTPILARSFGIPLDRSEEFTTFLAREVGHTQPLGRVGQPEDVADVALFLASDLSRYMTGVTLPVDGGATAITQGGYADDLRRAVEEFQAAHAE